MDPASYLRYLDELTGWAEAQPEVLGLVGLGSTALGDRQPDAMSDHDVFIVTTDGAAGPRRDDLSWLPAAERIVLVFPETVHGRGVVYDDGHLVELAVFDDHELELARVNVYRVFLDRAGIADRLAAMAARDAAEVAAGGGDPDGTRRFQHWVVQMVIGLGRYGRGEALSANERVRGKAMTALLALVELVVPAGDPAVLDDLDPHRRFERAYPALGSRLGVALERPVPELARVMLDVADAHFAGRIPSATPEVMAALRALLGRVTGPA